MTAAITGVAVFASDDPLRVDLAADRVDDNGMAKLWATPLFPKGRVDWAGDVLINPAAPDDDKDWSFIVVNNWRSSHSYPLQALKMTLRSRARQRDSRAIIAQRLKRLSSIRAKLARNANMHLSQMQDIGGCRAVVKDIKSVYDIVKAYEESWAKNPRARAEFVKRYDYIANPKIDGYRSVHLIYKYRTKSRRHRVWNGLRIEIQVRSRLQHAWATAVETVDAFTGQGLKVSGGTGTEKRDWGRFFALMSSAIACREKSPMVPETPTSEADLVKELRALSQQLKVVSTLAGWSYLMKRLGRAVARDSVLFLLILDPEKYTFNYTGYKKSEMGKAQQDYIDVEKKLQSTPGSQAVLVSVDSMEAVRAAYPNFYADTSAFSRALQDAIAEKGTANGGPAIDALAT